MYAVIESGGKQYRVELGMHIQVDRLDVEPGQTIQLERVLLVADGDQSFIGRPVVEGAVVHADVLGQDRGQKVVVFKYRPKARRRVKKGHRAELTTLRIADITHAGRSAATEEARAAADRDRAAEEAQKAAARQAAADQALAAKLAEAATAADAGEAIATPGARAGARGSRAKAARAARASADADGEQPAPDAPAEASQDGPDTPASTKDE